MSSKSTVLPKEIAFSRRNGGDGERDGAESVSSGVSGFTCDLQHERRAKGEDWNPMCRFNCFGRQGQMQPRSDLLYVDRDMHELLVMSQTINSDEDFSFSDTSSLGLSDYTDDDYLRQKEEEEEKYGSVEHDDLPTQSTDESYLQPKSSITSRRFEVSKTSLFAALLTAYACSVGILGSHFRTIIIGVKVVGAVTISCWRPGDQPKARQARSFIPTTRGLLIILYMALWNQAVGGAVDYFLLNDGLSINLLYGVGMLSRAPPLSTLDDVPKVQSFSEITPTLETTTTTIIVDDGTNLSRKLPEPTPLESEIDYLYLPSHQLRFSEDVDRNDFATRQELAPSIPDESIQSIAATLASSHEEIVLPREQRKAIPPLKVVTKAKRFLSRTKGQIHDAIAALKKNIQAHKLRRQQLNASTNIWPDFDLLHGKTMLD